MSSLFHGKDAFLDIADDLTLGASIPFESTHKEDNHKCQTMLDDPPEGMGVLVSPRSLLRIRKKEGEVPRSELCSRLLSTTMHHSDLKLLVCHWSWEGHTFLAVWGSSHLP